MFQSVLHISFIGLSFRLSDMGYGNGNKDDGYAAELKKRYRSDSSGEGRDRVKVRRSFSREEEQMVVLLIKC